MLTRQRKTIILEALARDGQVVAKPMSVELNVSEDTVRRDLRELAAEGLLQRVHGGALPASPTVVGLPSRRALSPEAKSALGRVAATLISPGSTVIFDGGTTHLEIVRHLPLDVAFVAVTHSPEIAMAFEHHRSVDVVLIGGTLFRHSMVAVGASAAEAIHRIRADLFFLGVTGVHEDEGVSTGDMEEAAIKRAFVSRSAETVVLATANKIGAVSPFQIAPITDIATLVVDADAFPSSAERIAARGVTVIRAEP